MDRLLTFLTTPLGKRILISIALFVIGLRFDIFLVFIPFVFWPWRHRDNKSG